MGQTPLVAQLECGGWLATSGGFDDLLQHLDLLRVNVEFVPQCLQLAPCRHRSRCQPPVPTPHQTDLDHLLLCRLGHASCTAGHLLWVTCQMKGTSMRQGVDAKEGVQLKLPAWVSWCQSGKNSWCPACCHHCCRLHWTRQA